MDDEKIRNAVVGMQAAVREVMGMPPAEHEPVPTVGIRLGAPVTFDYSDILRRQQISPYDHRSPIRKDWRKVKWGTRGDVRSGVIVGVRTLANGTLHWYSDEPIQFYPDLYFTAYLVAFHLRRKPVFLLPDDVEVHHG
jgi:hypothetical protein